MTTTNIVMDRALTLAREGTGDEVAIPELLDCCGENRVAVVMARRRILDLTSDDAINVRAAELLDELLVRLSED